METKTYRAAPHLRRCVIYLIVGFVLLLLSMAALAIFVSPTQWVGLVFAYSLVFVLFSSFAPIWRWAILIDDGGLDRRRLFRWDRWTWDDFASGRIEKRHPMEFIDPRRPWWRRKLSIGMLSNSDLKEVIGKVNEHYRLPAPVCPALLRLNFALRKSVEFDGSGIRVKKGVDSWEFIWSDVSRLRIVRMDPLRRDFASLELALPVQEIELRRGPDGRAFWSCASAEEVNEFLLAHVSPERVVIDIFGECPTQVVDIEKLLQRARKTQRQFRAVGWFLAGFTAVGGFLLALDTPILQAILMLSLLFGLLSAGIWVLRKVATEQTAKLESWLTGRRQTQTQ